MTSLHLASEVTSEAPIKVAQPLTSLHFASEVSSEVTIKVAQPLTSPPLSLRGNFRSHHQSRTATHPHYPLASEVTHVVSPSPPPAPLSHSNFRNSH